MTRVKTGAVNVEGLRELSKALKELDVEAGSKELGRELRTANKAAATHVRDRAYSRALTIGGVAAKAAPSLKASAGATSAGVALGSNAHPYAAGAEFGGGARTVTQQFKPWRGNGSNAGYFLYPTIRAEADEILEPYLEAVADVMRKAGLA